MLEGSGPGELFPCNKVRSGADLQWPLDLPYSRQDLTVALVFVPNTDDVLLNTHAQHTTANLIFILELVSDEGKDEVFPEPICNSLAQPNTPLPSVDI